MSSNNLNTGDTKEMNFMFFNSLRNAAKHDLIGACMTHGVTKEVAEQVRDSTLQELMQLSACVVPVFRFQIKTISEMAPAGRVKTLLAHFAERRPS
jgi:hypothetical protein